MPTIAHKYGKTTDCVTVVLFIGISKPWTIIPGIEPLTQVVTIKQINQLARGMSTALRATFNFALTFGV